MKRFLSTLFGFALLAISSHPVFAATIIPADNPYIQYSGRWDFTDPLALRIHGPGSIFTPNSRARAWARGSTTISATGTCSSTGLPEGVSGKHGRHRLVHPGVRAGGRPPHFAFAQAQRNDLAEKILPRTDSGRRESLLPPPAKPARKIEFIGDSFTSAEWNELTGTGTPASDAPYTNIYEGFGPIVARHYGAQVHMTSISGWGMVLDWQGVYTNNIPSRFDKTHTYTVQQSGISNGSSPTSL